MVWVVRTRVWAALGLLLVAGCVTDLSREELAGEYHNLGDGFYQLKQWDRAIRYYELALDRNPEAASTRWNLALAYYRGSRYDDAEAILLDWLERDPEAIEARETLALVYHGQRRDDEALAMLDEVLVAAPENTRALGNRALFLWDLGRLSEAADTLTRILAYEPYEPDALYDLTILSQEQGLLLRAEEYAEAYLSVAADLEGEEDHVLRARYVLAHAQERAEAYYRALEIYGEIVEKDDDEAAAWFGQAAILLTSVEDPVHGLAALEKALERGYRDKAEIASLVARDDLLDRPRVEELLREREAYPADQEIAAARADLQDFPPVDAPTGPWAEPGVDQPPRMGTVADDTPEASAPREAIPPEAAGSE